jgi:proline iminopeptidase
MVSLVATDSTAPADSPSSKEEEQLPLRMEGFLRRGKHKLYWAESGEAGGPPLLILPAGPGAGHLPAARTVFDPACRIIQIDPRGCGKSEPAGTLEENTTSHLVEDIEALRNHLGVSAWVIVGHLWGAALAIAYAQAYPRHCRGLVVASVYLGTRQDREWFFGGAGAMLPAEWGELLSALPPEERSRPLQALKQRIDNPDPAVRDPAAAALMKYDRAIVRYWPGTRPADDVVSDGDIHFLRIFLHYLENDFFLGDALLENIGRIRHIPAAIVQGRFDIASGMASAFRLSRAWPEAQFITPLGGSGYQVEPMRSHVRQAVDRLVGVG